VIFIESLKQTTMFTFSGERDDRNCLLTTYIHAAELKSPSLQVDIYRTVFTSEDSLRKRCSFTLAKDRHVIFLVT